MKLNILEKLYINSPAHTVSLRRNVRFLAALQPLGSGSTVVEIGCGRGVGMELVLRRFQPAHADALDIDPKMIARTRRRLRNVPEDRVSVRLADVHELPYKSGSVDAVFDFGVLHHLERWRHGLSEVSRVLKPGGHFYIEEVFPALYANSLFGRLAAHPKEDRFDAQEFRDALSAVGLALADGFAETTFRLLGVAVKSVAEPGAHTGAKTQRGAKSSGGRA